MDERQGGTTVEERPPDAHEVETPSDFKEEASKRLYRSRQDRMIAGVSGGLGQYFDVDPVIVRLVFLLLLFTGPGVLAYIILWIVVPERPIGEPEPKVMSHVEGGRGREWIAIALVAFGALMLASNFHVFGFFDWALIWPVVLILVGAALLLNRNSK